jgi:hypothetical protein
VPARNRSALLAFAVTLDEAPSGRSISAVATPIDDTAKLVTLRATLVVSLWRESPTIIRGTIKHASGAVAYFQGGEPLAEIARVLQLNLEPCEETAG